MLEAPNVFVNGRLSTIGGGGGCGGTTPGTDGYLGGAGCIGAGISGSGGDGGGTGGGVDGGDGTNYPCNTDGGGGGGAAGRIIIRVSPAGGSLVLDGQAEIFGAADYGYITPF